MSGKLTAFSPRDVCRLDVESINNSHSPTSDIFCFANHPIRTAFLVQLVSTLLETDNQSDQSTMKKHLKSTEKQA